MPGTNANSLAELNALFCAVFSGQWLNVAANSSTSVLTNLYVSLHNAAPGASGSQNTSETAYTNYGRIAVARTTGGWTVSGGAPNTVTNAAAINFAACGATGDTLTHWGVGSASSGAGLLFDWGPIGPTTPDVPFTCTLASPGVITCYGYTPTVNDRVMVTAAPGNEALPTGFTEGTVYYVGTASGQTCTLSTTASNGAPVNTSSTGSGFLYKCSPLIVSSGITPQLAIGALLITKY